MDAKTVNILSELIQAQSSALRALALLCEAEDGDRREALNGLMVESAEHLAVAVKVFSDD